MDIARTTERAAPIRAYDTAASGPASDSVRARAAALRFALALALPLLLAFAAADGVPRGEKSFAKVQLVASAAPSFAASAPSAERFARTPAQRLLDEVALRIAPRLGSFYDRLASALTTLTRSDAPEPSGDAEGRRSALPAVAKSGLRLDAVRLER